MLPVATSINLNVIQTPLINTAIPGSEVTRVAYDTVAPSVSGAQVDNNTNGNNAAVIASASQPAAEDAVSDSFPNFIRPQNAAGAQTSFITQLIAQDSSPTAQIILVQYEKLVALSNVKYKPSNALKPSIDPAGSFGKLLHDSHAQVEPAAAPVQVEQHAASNDNAPAAEPTPQPVQTATPIQNAAPQQVLDAYAQSAARPGIASGTVIELV